MEGHSNNKKEEGEGHHGQKEYAEEKCTENPKIV